MRQLTTAVLQLLDPPQPQEQDRNDDQLHYKCEAVGAGGAAVLKRANKTTEPTDDYDSAQEAIGAGASFKVGNAGDEREPDSEEQARQVMKVTLEICAC